MKIQHGHGPLRGLVVISLCAFDTRLADLLHARGPTVLHYGPAHGDDMSHLCAAHIRCDVRMALGSRAFYGAHAVVCPLPEHRGLAAQIENRG